MHHIKHCIDFEDEVRYDISEDSSLTGIEMAMTAVKLTLVGYLAMTCSENMNTHDLYAHKRPNKERMTTVGETFLRSEKGI